jgi:hypothetical protein
MTQRSQLYQLPPAYQRMRRSVPVVNPAGSNGRVESPSRFHGSGGLWWIVANQRGYYRGRKLPKGRTTGVGKTLSRLETTKATAGGESRGRKLPKCRVASVGKVYRGRKLPKGRTGGVGSESMLELQKGGYAGSRRRRVIGLDHRLGPIQRKYGRSSRLGCATRLWSLMGTSEHLCRV